MGIARTFQNTELFGEMSAVENVMIGLDCHYSYGVVSGIVAAADIIRWKHWRAARHENLLSFVGCWRR